MKRHLSGARWPRSGQALRRVLGAGRWLLIVAFLSVSPGWAGAEEITNAEACAQAKGQWQEDSLLGTGCWVKGR